MERIRRSDWKERRAPLKTRTIVQHGHQHASTNRDAMARLAERAELDKLPDPRTPGDVFLGDPPPWQSALAKARPEHVAPAMLVGSFVGASLRRMLSPMSRKYHGR